MTEPGPSHAALARALVATARSAALATFAREPAGFPYASLVAVTCDERGRPLLLLSRLAEHTQNLAARAEASLLVAEDAPGDPLAAGRVTLIGACARVVDAETAAARARFLAAHPSAAAYVDFADFAFHRLEPAALRYVGGFGRMSWISAEDYAAAPLA
ncbi:MAG TPA: pyridoxamine 5'-phosphate oxidase family protein [Byssovorax sp.]